ncbi:hypothetical protein ABEY61_29440 [Bacillus toyonensis]|uniref:hypothetical protein n=1 Tax=Bacillus toyonensis TaxID=155322 RepID=UPI003D20A54A
MKNTLYLCIFSILSVILIGCSVQKEHPEGGKNAIQLNTKDIQEIRLDSAEKDKLSKTLADNEELIDAVTMAINTGTPKEIKLDKKARDTVHANMTVTLKNDSKEHYLVWIDNKKEIIIAKDTKVDRAKGILINSKDVKLVNKFFENKNSTD